MDLNMAVHKIHMVVITLSPMGENFLPQIEVVRGLFLILRFSKGKDECVHPSIPEKIVFQTWHRLPSGPQ
jgi:hypothetical protein